MPLTFHIRNRTYMLDGVEGIVIKYELLLDRARELVQKHKLDGKIGDNFIDIALDNLEETLKNPPELVPSAAQTVYVRYNEDDGRVYLVTEYYRGTPRATHYPIGYSTIVEFGPTANGPWTRSQKYVSV